jgi:hypothetical protein
MRHQKANNRRQTLKYFSPRKAVSKEQMRNRKLTHMQAFSYLSLCLCLCLSVVSRRSYTTQLHVGVRKGFPRSRSGCRWSVSWPVMCIISIMPIMSIMPFNICCAYVCGKISFLETCRTHGIGVLD